MATGRSWPTTADSSLAAPNHPSKPSALEQQGESCFLAALRTHYSAIELEVADED